MSNGAVKLDIGNLDFDAIKTSLRDFLRSQTEFRDYDFEAAGLNVLLDTLAYNTHYMAFYMNMIASEMFLDSASMRSSVVSHAKHLGHTPRSMTSAEAFVNIKQIPNDSGTSCVIPAGTSFVSTVDNQTFTFVTDRAYTAALDLDGSFTFSNVKLVEGVPYTYRIVVNSSIPNQRFILPNANVDTKHITVRVQQSNADTTLTTYTLATDLLELKSTTNAFFLQEVENQKYELTFGDGIIGRKLVDGNVVIINYILSSGPISNGASVFTPSNRIGGYPAHLTTITTVVPASGGLDPDTIDQIRFSAPKNFQIQNRAVTAADYKLMIQDRCPTVDSVVVWGGEESTPPQYGKVFISVKPVNGYVVSDAAKQLIIGNVLRQRTIVSVIPELVDPDYTFLIVNCRVKYNPASTTKTTGDITASVLNSIVSFSKTDLDKFDSALRYSRLLTTIDNTDTSIISNLTSVLMKKTFTPNFDVLSNYNFAFHNAITPGTLKSTAFVVAHDPKLLIPYANGTTYTLQDDSSGNVMMYQHAIGTPDQQVRTCGTVNYLTGEVTLTEFIPYKYADGTISLIATPNDSDIVPVFNNILYLKPSDITVVAIPVLA